MNTSYQDEIDQDWNNMLQDALILGYIDASFNIDDPILYEQTCERMEQHYQDLKVDINE